MDDDNDAVIVRRTMQNMPTDADADTTKRAAQLEANNAALHAALSSKNAHIAMLEERILKMSVELASSRAREDEQKLIYRRRATQVQVDNIMSPSEDDNDGEILLQDGLVIPKPVRNTKRTGRLRRRGSSRGSSVSPCSDDQAAADHLIIDDGIKSAPPPTQIQTTSTSTSTNNHRRFSLMSGGRGSSNSRTTPQEDLNDSERSLNSAGGGGFGNFIGNLIHTLDRSDKSDDLNVNFPHTGRRRSSLMDDNPNSSTTTVVTNNSHLQEQHQHQQQQQQRRVSVVGQLFRLRNKSELTANNDAVEEEEEEEEIICEKQQEETTTSCEHQQQQQEEGQQAHSSSQDRRRPNRSKMLKIQASTRLISSTVAFPREDDDYDWGFE